VLVTGTTVMETPTWTMASCKIVRQFIAVTIA
jgi:hypothetical protein